MMKNSLDKHVEKLRKKLAEKWSQRLSDHIDIMAKKAQYLKDNASVDYTTKNNS